MNGEVSSLDHVPASARWEFDAAVTDCFEDMLRRSIPQYDVMRDLVTEIGTRYAVRPCGQLAVVDLGCSRGEALEPLVHRFGSLCKFVGVEVSTPMLEAAQKRFSAQQAAGYVEILKMDLRTDFPSPPASLVLSVLTLQFIPVTYRQRILRTAYDRLVSGGALILVEKILGSDDRMESILVDLYHAYKSANGYSADAIARKSMALEGVLVPASAEWNETMLRRAGFAHVETFWRYLNFAGWLAVKA